MKKGCVISGGGAYGAMGAGTLAGLNKDYDMVAGVSTGALMAPLVALGKWDVLKEAYTSVDQKDIFSVNPFRKNGKINIKKAAVRILSGAVTLGETKSLRETIDRFVMDKDFEALRSGSKEVIVAAQNTMTEPSSVFYFKSSEWEPEDFKDWMWASANAPLVTSVMYKNVGDMEGEWTDAGLTELLSLKKLVEEGCEEIDVVIHRPRLIFRNRDPLKDVFHNVARLFGIMRHEIERNDLQSGLAAGKREKCRISVYWLTRRLGENSLLFDKKEMLRWWEEGFNTAFDEARIDRYFPETPV